jgi:hypothetical protein
VTADIHADFLFQGVNAEHIKVVEDIKIDIHDDKSPGKDEQNGDELATQEREITRPSALNITEHHLVRSKE